MSKQKQLSKRLIRREAKKLLKTGISRQETYEQLTQKFKYRKLIADVLEDLPSKKAKAKYGVWNYILLALLIVVSVISYFELQSFGSLIYCGILIYVVAKMLTQYYLWITVLSALFLISSVVLFFLEENVVINWLNTFLTLALTIVFLILPTWLANKLTPTPVKNKLSYKAATGKQNFMVNYEFPED